jgi:hypothetical protein
LSWLEKSGLHGAAELLTAQQEIRRKLTMAVLNFMSSTSPATVYDGAEQARNSASVVPTNVAALKLRGAE